MKSRGPPAQMLGARGTSRSFRVFCFTFSSVIHFEFIFVEVIRTVSRLFFAWACPLVPAPFVKKTILSPLDCLCSFVKNQLTIFVWVCFWAPYSGPLIYMSVIPPIPHYLGYHSFMLNFESGSFSPPTLFLFFNIMLNIVSLFPFHIKYRIRGFCIHKITCWDFYLELH